ncbi:MAG TPA: NPCBM/NEW2 domain-containing protein [Gemmataceae bacterium]|nr:NPCBM/NEW2 domain-containing protein [Gemmataceae bacterium]
MSSDGSRLGVNPFSGRLLAVIAFVWTVLALLCWVFPALILRALLAILAGCILLGALGYYCFARWAGRFGQADSAYLRKPIAVCVAAWLFCLGTALTSAFARRADNESPPPQPAASRSKFFPDGPCRFLSDLQEFEVVNGEWPFTKGETGDGHVIKVSGVKSPRGLGMHPPWASKFASVKYKVGTEAAVFKATVALNDTTSWNFSPAYFTVWGDGKEPWRSQPSSFDFARSEECRVNIRGVNVLELRVEVANGNHGVHAVWFEPRILQTADAPDVPPKEALFQKDPREFLSKLMEFDVKPGPWPFAKNGNLVYGKSKIKAKGVHSANGLSMHPPEHSYSAAKYLLNKKAALFKAAVALDDSVNSTRNPAVFEVLGDGKQLWESEPVNRGTPPQACSIDVAGVEVLELRVHAKPSEFGLYAVWIEPRLLQSADTPDK